MRVLSKMLLAVTVCVACGCGREDMRSAAPDASWTVTAAGAGDVRLGMSRTLLTARGGAVRSESEACEYVIPQGAPPGVRAMVINGVVRRIDIAPPGIRTAENVGVGSTEAQIRAAYRNVSVQPHKYTSGHYLIADLPPGALGGRRLVFETDGSTVTRYRVGFMPEVEWVEGCG